MASPSKDLRGTLPRADVDPETMAKSRDYCRGSDAAQGEEFLLWPETAAEMPKRLPPWYALYGYMRLVDGTSVPMMTHWGKPSRTLAHAAGRF